MSDQPDDEGLSLEEITAVVDEANRHGGRPVAAHAQGTAGVLNAIRGGVTSIEHGYGIDDECIDEMLARGTVLVPTLSAAMHSPERGTVPDYLYEKWVRWSEVAQKRLAHAFSRGVKVALGTDAGAAPHGANLRELAHMVTLGMTPMHAVEAGTRHAADLMGLGAELGTLEAGKLADLVVCDGDPLACIDVLADPAHVVLVAKEGRIVKHTPCQDRRSA
ncbi:amidohydrolase family protein [Saccharopolyspora sp. NPDC050389]|uniref:amidohydrolase family protein n=1 Tax=Saccharopolyspora sp. NPDC050389 TaxID=3155516 RepID=UPI0033CBA622